VRHRIRSKRKTAFNDKGSCGFTFAMAARAGVSEGSLFGKKQQGSVVFADMPKSRRKTETAS